MGEVEYTLCSQCRNHFPHENGLCLTCFRKDERLKRNAQAKCGQVVPFYVAAIGIDRRYGGPEEGGWWYDVNTVLQVFKVWDVKQAVRQAHALKEEFPTCPRGRHSVIGGTDTYVRTFRSLDDLPEEDHSRPRYE